VSPVFGLGRVAAAGLTLKLEFTRGFPYSAGEIYELFIRGGDHLNEL
jgi:hypothetical protein